MRNAMNLRNRSPGEAESHRLSGGPVFCRRRMKTVNRAGRIREACRVSPSTVERTRKRFVADGFRVAVRGKKREVFREKIPDGKVEARLIALRCGNPPTGYAKRIPELPAGRMVELKYVEHISRESVRKILKKKRA